MNLGRHLFELFPVPYTWHYSYLQALSTELDKAAPSELLLHAIRGPALSQPAGILTLSSCAQQLSCFVV